ncbi:hypothetical protein Dda_8254 [Drechslerella dactyloides]|uniref:Uncharacterized protein n=1 Tax=Drechslerella dactyloides TaxID=74499 RepID=A0AAD6NGF6_DREDA|nr:hypothetical protein Dda_8254 [Drechslerella dactyloides]
MGCALLYAILERKPNLKQSKIWFSQTWVILCYIRKAIADGYQACRPHAGNMTKYNGGDFFTSLHFLAGLWMDRVLHCVGTRIPFSSPSGREGEEEKRKRIEEEMEDRRRKADEGRQKKQKKEGEDAEEGRQKQSKIEEEEDRRRRRHKKKKQEQDE